MKCILETGPPGWQPGRGGEVKRANMTHISIVGNCEDR